MLSVLIGQRHYASIRAKYASIWFMALHEITAIYQVNAML